MKQESLETKLIAKDAADRTSSRFKASTHVHYNRDHTESSCLATDASTLQLKTNFEVMLKLSSFSIFLFVFALCGEIKSNLLPGRDVCGKQTEDRIYGGIQTGIAEFPWMALLGITSNRTGDAFYICGGALINRRYILTAAHCAVEDITIVRLGEHDVDKKRDCEDDTPGLEDCSDDPIDVGIEKKIPHKDYDDETHVHDIALLRLKKEVNYTNYVTPICLPLTSELKNQKYEGTTLTTAGWGVTEKGYTSGVKLKVDLSVVPNSNCTEIYKKYDLPIEDSHICAGGEEGKDSCQGDSGGPLMLRDRVKDEENFIAVGVVSFGYGCGIKGVPGVYARVTDYREWIAKNIEP
ncbi:hypothetical protein ILUMI_03135 [Ignelater luminosus]|uniref:Peptidase S1 domain-containing protein n=1 Tax=Ignelater luminosus TaxID=2038154 RepID=A0A8K0DBI1_IGNLU|nr:hypothetical protein ILUMI_03135 [Ignelater luminosus]